MYNECKTSFVALETTFRACHGSKLKTGHNAIQTVLNMIFVPENIPLEVAVHYIRCRIYFKIKKMNKNDKEECLRSHAKKTLKTVK